MIILKSGNHGTPLTPATAICDLSHHHIITSPHHHIITSSHHHIITSPHHHIAISFFFVPLAINFLDIKPHGFYH
ncbi:MAG: hypothetical protein LBN98_00805 [Prevotellaceae bacterium]|nr:hypothetical protein [Prevotellaceae bacterium]